MFTEEQYKNLLNSIIYRMNMIDGWLMHTDDEDAETIARWIDFDRERIGAYIEMIHQNT